MITCCDISPPMTLGNMRSLGVRSVSVWYAGRDCNHETELSVDGFSDDLPVPPFGPRLRCKRCGHLGANVRPNWLEYRASSFRRDLATTGNHNPIGLRYSKPARHR